MVNVHTKLEDLNLVDRFLFSEAMESKEVYQAAINILLENEVELLGSPETEKELRVSPELRQVRLDVIGMDEEKTLYYTEMQKRNTGNLKKRSRYYQAQLDVSLLETGCKNFNLLNNSCLILIAPFDIFGRKLYRYTFEGTCRECPDLRLEDGAIRVFINTNGTNAEDFSQEFLDFMEYITAYTDEKVKGIKSNRIRLIHEKVERIRASEKAGMKYMQRWEEIEYARDDGREEGFIKRLIQMVCKKIRRGKTIAEIADDLEEDLEQIEKIYNVAQEFAPTYDLNKIYDKCLEEYRGTAE